MENIDHKQCARCQSQSMMYPLEIIEYPRPFQLKLTAPSKADAWVNLNVTKGFDVHSAVCGNCGYTEFYTDKPKDMWEKWQAGFR